jgi:hypothetical protein
MTTLAFVFLSVNHRQSDENRYWRAATILAQNALVLTCVVALFYWTVLWTLVRQEPERTFYTGRYRHTFGRIVKAGNFLNHGVPFLFMLIDFGFNKLTWDWKHYPIHVIIALAYLVVNFCVTMS